MSGRRHPTPWLLATDPSAVARRAGPAVLGTRRPTIPVRRAVVTGPGDDPDIVVAQEVTS